MKAVRLLEYSGQLVFTDVPTPTIARDEILVKIKSTAVNHLDLVKASGTARQILPIDLPWTPGHEFSGVVEQIGSDVAAYAPGLHPRSPGEGTNDPDPWRGWRGGRLGGIARLLEEGTIRPDVASVYALQDAAQAWKDIAAILSPSGSGAARRRSHGKIVLCVA